MLNIYKDNIPFVLPTEIEVPFIFRSPFFNDHASRTGPIELPAKSNINNFLLNYPARKTKSELSKQSFDVILENFTFRKSLLLKLQESNSQNHKGILLFDNGRFYNLVKNVSLKNINLGTYLMGSTTEEIIEHANSIVDKIYPETNHNFPMLASEDFYGEANELNPEFCKYSNFYEEGFGYQFNKIRSEGEVMQNLYNLVPSISIFFILEKIFEQFGYHIEGHGFVNDPQIRSLELLSNTALDLIEIKYKLLVGMFVAQTIGLTGEIIKFNNDSLGGCFDLDDCHSIVTYKTKIKEEGWHRFKLSVSALHTDPSPPTGGVPILYFKLFLDNDEIIQLDTFTEILTVTWNSTSVETVQFFDQSAIGKVVYFKAYFKISTVDLPTIGKLKDGRLEIENISAVARNRFVSVLNYTDHVPDITVQKFIEIVELLTCSIFDFDDNKRLVNINFFKDILNKVDYKEGIGQVVKDSENILHSEIITGFKLGYENSSDIDLSNYNRLPDVIGKPFYAANLQLNDIVLSTTLESYFIFRPPENDPDADPDWQFLCKNDFPYSLNPDTDNIEERTIEAELPEMVINDLPFLVPKLENGNSKAYSQKVNEQPVSVIFYHGLVNNDSGQQYPFASPYNLSMNGEKIADFSLKPISLANTLWMDYITWVLRRIPLEFKSYLTFSFLQLLYYSGKYRLQGVNYIINSIELGMTLNSLTEATVKTFTV